jgi:iron(III) transport system substrate-binding protein
MMQRTRNLRLLDFMAATVFLLTAGCSPHGPVYPAAPHGYPAAYNAVIEAAHREKSLQIWSVTDRQQVEPLLADFQRIYPQLAVNYTELPAEQLYRNSLEAAAGRRASADLLWSSAMDLQIKLVNDGFAQPYHSPELPNLPDWAVWKDEAWGVTAEPIVITYNRKLLPPEWVPDNHTDLMQLLRTHGAELRGKLATYDPVKSAVGFLYLAQDQQANHDTWELARDMGNSGVRLFATTEEILQQLRSDKIAIAYNMVGSYALSAQAKDPDIAVVLPRDYTLVMSRIAVIPRSAASPNAARLFLDYLLSRRGQALLAERYMSSIRTDIAPPQSLRLDGTRERSIRVGPALLVHQDKLTREHLLREWQRAITAGPAASQVAYGN